MLKPYHLLALEASGLPPDAAPGFQIQRGQAAPGCCWSLQMIWSSAAWLGDPVIPKSAGSVIYEDIRLNILIIYILHSDLWTCITCDKEARVSVSIGVTGWISLSPGLGPVPGQGKTFKGQWGVSLCFNLQGKFLRITRCLHKIILVIWGN